MKYPRHIVAAVIIQKQQLLMIKNGVGPRKGLWGFPGGSVEWGETIEQALERELREECNLQIQVQRLYKLTNLIVQRENQITDHFILSHHHCRIIGGQLKAGSDALDAKWLSLPELKQISQEGGIIQQLLEGIIQEISQT